MIIFHCTDRGELFLKLSDCSIHACVFYFFAPHTLLCMCMCVVSDPMLGGSGHVSDGLIAIVLGPVCAAILVAVVVFVIVVVVVVVVIAVVVVAVVAVVIAPLVAVVVFVIVKLHASRRRRRQQRQRLEHGRAVCAHAICDCITVFFS